MQKFIRENYQLFLIICCSGLLAYSFELTHGTMTPDEELAWDSSTKFLRWNASLGRWALYAYRYLLLPDMQFPIISCIYSILALSASCVLWLHFRPQTSYVAKILCGSLIVSCPIFGHMLTYSFMCAQVCFSAAFIVGAYVLIAYGSDRLSCQMAAIALMVFSIFTYQSLIFIPFSLFLIDNFNRYFSKDTLKLLVRIILSSAITLLLYFTLNYILMNKFEIVPTDYGMSFIGWVRGNVWNEFVNIGNYIKNIINLNNYTFQPIMLAAFPLAILAALRPSLNTLFSICVIMLFSISIYICFASVIPVRSLFYIPYLCGGLFILAYETIKPKYLKYFLLFIGWYTFCLSSSINANFSLLDALARDRDKTIAARVMNQIYDTCPDYMNEAGTVVVIGTLPQPDASNSRHHRLDTVMRMDGAEMFGQSYFDFGPGNEGRIISYMMWLGIEMPWLDSQAKKQEIENTESFRQMPAYPEPGFVKIIDDTLVIKLSG